MAIYGIGHSTRTFDELILLLQAHQITLLVDIRSYPSSARYPHFNRDSLIETLKQEGIEYFHLPELGGKRKAQKGPSRHGFENASFRGYAEYMESDEFVGGIYDLIDLSKKNNGGTAIMCSEGNPYQCHRRLVMDYLVYLQHPTFHISSRRTAKEHEFSRDAKIVDGMIIYHPHD